MLRRPNNLYSNTVSEKNKHFSSQSEQSYQDSRSFSFKQVKSHQLTPKRQLTPKSIKFNNQTYNDVSTNRNQVGTNNQSTNKRKIGGLANTPYNNNSSRSPQLTDKRNAQNYAQLNQQKTLYKQISIPKLNFDSSNKFKHNQNKISQTKSQVYWQKQNEQPNSSYYDSRNNRNQYVIHEKNFNKGENYHNRKPSNSQITAVNQMMLPVVLNYSNNYNNNYTIDDSSSIKAIQSSRLTINNQTESTFLKEKLIQTHNKLIKQLEISKDLEQNLFEQKKRYEQLYKKYKQNQQIIKRYKQSQQQKNRYNSQQRRKSQQQLKRLNQQIQHLSNQLQRLRQKQNQFFKKQKYFNEKLSQYKYSSNDISQKLNKQTTVFYNEIEKHKEKVIESKNDLESMRNKVLDLIKEKQLKDQKIFQLKEIIKQVEDKFKVLESKLQRKDAQFNQKEDLCEIWRKKYLQIQQDYKKLEENNINQQKAVNEIKLINNDLTVAVKQQKQKNAQMLSQIISIQMQNKDLKNKLQAIIQQKKELKDKLFQCSSQKNITHQKLQLQQQLQKLTTEYNSLSAIINKKDKELKQLKNNIDQKNNIIKSLQQEKLTRQKSQSQISSVKQFVNHLEQSTNKNAIAERNNFQNKQSQLIVKQNVNNSENNENRRSLSPKCITPSKIVRTQQLNNGNQNKNLKNAYNNDHMLICDEQQSSNNFYKDEQNFSNKNKFNQKKNSHIQAKQIYFINQDEQGQNSQNIQGNNEGYYYQDSLQNSYKINYNPPFKNQSNSHKSRNTPKSQSQFDKNNHHTQIPRKNSTLQLPVKRQENRDHSQKSKVNKNGKSQNLLNSYKQQKQQYLSLISEVGQLETQIYNLSQEKNRIVTQIEKIQNTKTKTKQMISKRRQLQLLLVGNDKQIHQLKDRLKTLRGNVV